MPSPTGGGRPGGIVLFWFCPFQFRLCALASARFVVTFDCPKVTKGHRGHFKPPPGPPGEGMGGFWCAFPEVWRPRPEAPLTRNGPGSLPMRVITRTLWKACFLSDCFIIGPGTSLKRTNLSAAPHPCLPCAKGGGVADPGGIVCFCFLLLNFTCPPPQARVFLLLSSGRK